MIQETKIKERYLPVFLLLLNFFIKVIYLDYGCISGDEPFTLFHAQQSLSDLFALFQNENNPPLHFVLSHFWIELFGITAFASRFLSLIFSTATVYFIYKLAHKSFNIRIAIIASLIYTFSNYHIFFAHEMRVYSLFALLTTISMYAFISLISEKKSRKYFILLILSNALLIYAHFFGFIIIAIQGLSVIWIKELRKNIFKQFSLSALITLVLYAPYFPIFIKRFLSSSGGTWVSPPSIESLYNNLWKFSNAPVNTVTFLSILLAALIFVLIGKTREVKYKKAFSKIVLIWFLFPYLFLFAISFLIPMFLDRYLIFISIAYYLTIAIAIDFLASRKWVFYSLSIIAIGMMTITTNLKSGHNQDLKEVVHLIQESKDAHTAVVICPDWVQLGFSYHYNIEHFKNYRDTEFALNRENIFPVSDVKEINDSLLSQKNKIIYLDGWSELVDPDGLIFNKLNQNYRLINTNSSYKGMKVYTFQK